MDSIKNFFTYMTLIHCQINVQMLTEITSSHVILPTLCQLVYHIALSEKLNNLLVPSDISASASPENSILTVLSCWPGLRSRMLDLQSGVCCVLNKSPLLKVSHPPPAVGQHNN